MQDALKLAEEAINALIPRDVNGPLWKMHSANVALSAICAACAEWGWRPIAEMEAFEQEGVRIAYWLGDRWCVAPYVAYKRVEVPKCYTHFHRPQLPPPPAREES